VRPAEERRAEGRAASPPDALDVFLVGLFLFGIYIGWELRLSASTPLPAAIAGAAAGMMLLRRFWQLEERHVVALLVVLLLFLLSILSVEEGDYLGERFKGLIQLAYSLIVCLAFYLTARRFETERLARIFLIATACLLLGAALENYTPFKAVSDEVRSRLFEHGLYVSDRRDEALYGRVRPKVFASEPSALTFGFTLFSFAWYVLSSWRGKLLVYVGMLAAALFLMRGPTLVLGAALVLPYELFLASRRLHPNGVVAVSPVHVARALLVAGLLLLAAVLFGATFYADRIAQIAAGQDASFFGRVVAPVQIALKVLVEHPFAGVGLSGWELIERDVREFYATSQAISLDWRFERAQDAITNYLAEHWIFLGLCWGSVLLVALSWFLRVLGTPSVAFCWCVWAVMGQASGAYVAPKTWTVLFLAALLAAAHRPRPAEVRLAPPLALSERAIA